MSDIKKRVCITYETLTDMINDPDITDGLIVMTMGKNKVNDGKGSYYKIITKDEKGTAKINGVEFPKGNPYFAMNINTGSGSINAGSGSINESNTGDIKTIKNLINSSISTALSGNYYTKNEIDNKINDVNELALSASNKAESYYNNLQSNMRNSFITRIYGNIANDGISFILTTNGDKYICINKSKYTSNTSSSTLSTTLTDYYKWMIPTQIIISNYLITEIKVNNVVYISYNKTTNKLETYVSLSEITDTYTVVRY